jgi:guanosine-3',5'-bis(diphosphate) 3'-pyrophosphohydrolase
MGSEEGAGRWQEIRAHIAPALAPAMLATLDRAYALAAESHAGQTLEGGAPYIDHPLDVLAILFDGPGVRDPDLLAAALLHDVLERSAHTAAEIRAAFGDDVAALVAWLTEPDPEPGETEDAAKERYFARFAGAPERVLLLKLADRWSKARRITARPTRAAQAAYYAATVRVILPLAARVPYFARLFAAWRQQHRDLADD